MEQPRKEIIVRCQNDKKPVINGALDGIVWVLIVITGILLIFAHGR